MMHDFYAVPITKLSKPPKRLSDLPSTYSYGPTGGVLAARLHCLNNRTTSSLKAPTTPWVTLWLLNKTRSPSSQSCRYTYCGAIAGLCNMYYLPNRLEIINHRPIPEMNLSHSRGMDL